MRRIAFVLLSAVAILTPAIAVAASESVAVDTKVLMNAKVERNGKHVGNVQRVMIDPTTGRINHVDIVMTEGQQRTIAVPWNGVKLFQDNAGSMTVSLTSRAAAEASPSASPATFMASPSSDIAAAQQRLKNRGYYAGPVDGVMGPRTAAALRAYQRDHGLSTTGQLDAPTAGALVSDTPTATVVTPAGDVRTAQRQLKERGYYAGPIDGVIGPDTENALRAYQRDHGLKVTGRLDAPTVRSLTA